MRPINNVVDASNYVMLELGQPTHAYDRDRLAGPALAVRRAAPGESRSRSSTARCSSSPRAPLALGDTGEDLVICDGDDTAIGLAGIMGGASTEIDDATTSVVLEAAWFDADRRRAQRQAPPTAHRGLGAVRAGLRPDGVRPRRAQGRRAARRDAAPTCASPPGSSTREATLPDPPVLTVDAAGLEARLGVVLGLDEVARLLSAIGFVVRELGDALEVTAPSGRPDVRAAPFGLADVAEEVARLHGYAALPDARAVVARARRAAPGGHRAPRGARGARRARRARGVDRDDGAGVRRRARGRRRRARAGDQPGLRRRARAALGPAARAARAPCGTTSSAARATSRCSRSARPSRTPRSRRRARVERGGEHGQELVKLPSEDERVALLLARPGDDAARRSPRGARSEAPAPRRRPARRRPRRPGAPRRAPDAARDARRRAERRGPRRAGGGRPTGRRARGAGPRRGPAARLARPAPSARSRTRRAPRGAARWPSCPRGSRRPTSTSPSSSTRRSSVHEVHGRAARRGRGAVRVGRLLRRLPRARASRRASRSLALRVRLGADGPDAQRGRADRDARRHDRRGDGAASRRRFADAAPGAAWRAPSPR